MVDDITLQRKWLRLLGEDYPADLLDFEERFATEQACLDYPAKLRWAEQFV